MTLPDSTDLSTYLAQERTDAATCREAAIMLRRQRLTAITAEYAALGLAQLLNAVSLALAADGHPVPPIVRQAALRVADQLQCTQSVSYSSGMAADEDYIGPSGPLSAQCRRSSPPTTRDRSVPYTSSIKLGRMG
jgi:hypothetical protein